MPKTTLADQNYYHKAENLVQLNMNQMPLILVSIVLYLSSLNS